MSSTGLGAISFYPSSGPQTVYGSSEVIATSLQPVYSPLTWSVPFPGPQPWPVPLPGPGPLPGPLPGPILPPTDPAPFDHEPFKLFLFLRDVHSAETASLTLKGEINGTF